MARNGSRRSSKPAEGARFDREYYDRFYRDPATRVAEPEETTKLVQFVLAYLEFLGLPVDEALDLGCGVGPWRDALAELAPDIAYRGVEVSPYLCEEYGWEQGSVATYDGVSAPLVICQGVLQYLTAPEASRAIRNLGRLARGALFLEVLTRADWEHNCDRDRTDGDVDLREGSWYRERLARDFINIGGGLFIARASGFTPFELEALDPT